MLSVQDHTKSEPCVRKCSLVPFNACRLALIWVLSGKERGDAATTLRLVCLIEPQVYYILYLRLVLKSPLWLAPVVYLAPLKPIIAHYIPVVYNIILYTAPAGICRPAQADRSTSLTPTTNMSGTDAMMWAMTATGSTIFYL
jgi:hypothetical protein